MVDQQTIFMAAAGAAGDRRPLGQHQHLAAVERDVVRVDAAADERRAIPDLNTLPHTLEYFVVSLLAQ